MTAEVQWSELQRDPKGVAALTDQGAVRVRRRDGVPLLLIREAQSDAADAGALAAARTLRNALAHLVPAASAALMADEFPWIDVLPDQDRSQFLADFVRAVHVSAELGEWSHLAGVLQEWRSTARIHADPHLRARLTGDLDDDLGSVVEPSEV